MSKAVVLTRQLALDFNAPPKLPPRPPRLLSPEELRAQTDRNRVAMERKMRDLPPAVKRALRVRHPDYSDYGWRIVGLLAAVPDFDRVGGWASQPTAEEWSEILRELDVPHGGMMFVRCAHTTARVMLVDRTAVGRFQPLPAFA